jgi:hypothetical protein
MGLGGLDLSQLRKDAFNLLQCDRKLIDPGSSSVSLSR